MTEEEYAIDYLKKYIETDMMYENRHYKQIELVLNLIQKQDTEINSLKETIQKQEKSREHLKKQLKGEIAVKDTEIKKLNNVIDRMAEEYSLQANTDILDICACCNYNTEDCHGDYCKEALINYFTNKVEEDK